MLPILSECMGLLRYMRPHAWICPVWRDALGPQKNNGLKRHLQFSKQLWADLRPAQRATWPRLILLAQRVSEQHHFSLMKLVTLWKVTRLPLHWFMHWCSEAHCSTADREDLALLLSCFYIDSTQNTALCMSFYNRNVTLQYIALYYMIIEPGGKKMLDFYQTLLFSYF